ncbi:hypothetical protein BDV98DRAFT_208704 [Pterulicium gracile]|uniref:Uncharacterized protein n=1 Tax=Pterulicium gracile TaxID=1884261 RepID=A0A5C3QB54_9AGAR|nr:hypothetical protein BDV98DRAFT_208704 [Pterula gracilis]
MRCCDSACLRGHSSRLRASSGRSPIYFSSSRSPQYGYGECGLSGHCQALVEIAPPRTSARVWISFLRQAIISIREEPVFTIESLPLLISLVRYNVSARTLTSPMEKLLLAAYIFFAIRVDSVRTTPNSTLLEEALRDENVFFLVHGNPRDQSNIIEATWLYYSHACVDLIIHLSYSTPGADPLQYTLENLHPVIDLLTQASCEPSPHSNEDHPLLDLLPIL